MQNPIVHINKISKRFSSKGGSVQALKQLSLSVGQGEVLALLGPNGSGKSTTLNILSCLLDADEGQVKLLGRKPGHPQYFDDIAFMSGDSEYYWAFTLRRILQFYSRLKGVSWKEVMLLTEEFGLMSHLDRQ